LEEYRRIRALSIGLSPYLELIRIGSANLSANDSEHPTLSRLQRSAALLVAFANDIYSFAKEKKDGAPINLVSVLSNEFKLSIPEALDAAVETYNVDLAIFEREIATFNGLESSIRHYVNDIEDWVHGNLAWHGLSGRYA